MCIEAYAPFDRNVSPSNDVFARQWKITRIIHSMTKIEENPVEIEKQRKTF